MSSEVIDAQFHRAVDIVQSLPKGGPVQTTYEEKLWLYSLYKQGDRFPNRAQISTEVIPVAMEGDVWGPRPGMLDMLSRAKWDSWDKQKGVEKAEAKRLYVAALLKIFKRYADQSHVRAHVQELEAYTGGSRTLSRRAASPASSTSSYHSSQASPPPSPPAAPSYVLYPAPDPSLPAPDVATDIVPPSALTSSHRSLLSLAAPIACPPEPAGAPAFGLVPGSRAHSLIGEAAYGGRKDSVHSLRQNRVPFPTTTSVLGFVSEQPRASGSRPYSPQQPTTPDPYNSSPYFGIQLPTPIYPQRPGSASTFSPAPLTIPQTLQQNQTSLTALHERMSSLERTQGLLLRREDRRRGWFWTLGEADELDDMEEEVERARWPTTATATRKRRKNGLTIRVLWFLVTAIRRAIIDAGVGMMIALVGVIVLGGGWRRARVTLTGLVERARRFVREV